MTSGWKILAAALLTVTLGFWAAPAAPAETVGQERLGGLKPGDEVTIRILRDGRVVDLKTRLP